MKKKTIRALSMSMSVAMALSAVPAASVFAAGSGKSVQAIAQQEKWASYVNYATGDVVSHGGMYYQCRQGHMSLPGWEPNVVLALWLPVQGVPEPTVPETTVPETTVPETTVPETTVPETTVPETTVPETTVPETTVPETTVPETTVPETTVPETTVPETTVPETTVPETTAPAVIEVTSVKLNTKKLTLEAGKRFSLTAVVAPQNATDKTVTWTSGNEKVATVKDGVVTAVGKGAATITARAGKKIATCTVTVNEAVKPNPNPDHSLPPYPFWKAYEDTGYHPTDQEKNKYYYKGNIYRNKWYAGSGEIPGNGDPWVLVGPAEWTVPEKEENYTTPQNHAFVENEINKILTDAEVLERYGTLDPRFSPENALKSLDELIPESYYNELFPFRFGCDQWKTSAPVKIYYDHPELMEDYYSYQNLKEAVAELANTVVRLEWPEGAGYAFRVIRLDKTTHEQRHLMTHPDFYKPWNQSKEIKHCTIDYGAFISEGSLNDRKRELAGFLANVAHETGGGCFEGNPVEDAGAMYFNEEVTYIKGGSGYILPSHEVYKPVAGKSYHGRGPLQLSWNYNYGLCSDVLFNDASILLNHPEMVKDDGKVGFMTAIWFWMTPQSPKPSCHESMLGTWEPVPGAKNTQYNGSFGLTMVIINGEINHAEDSPTAVGRRARMYRTYTKKMGADITGEKCDTLGITQFA